MPIDIPHKALIVVADGVGARFFRNTGDSGKLQLASEGELKPSHLRSDGPSGHRPKDSSHQETDEATFAKQLAHELTRRVQTKDFAALVLIADPQTLGQIRPLLHKEVLAKIVREVHKTLTKAPVAGIERSLG